MNFEQEILRLCEEAVACRSEAGAAELARQVQSLMHARIEQLRGNLVDHPSPSENCLGLVVGAFLVDARQIVPASVEVLSRDDGSLDDLRKRLSEAHERWMRTKPPFRRFLNTMGKVFKRERPEGDEGLRPTQRADRPIESI